ncbi:MAG TPA: type II secretion system minor pseudopilin GspK [Burkholderiaceae bacterium]|nr:type II secretion system minor pseudopilin GspK [Burkholderiaceae bacterium]
MRNHRGAALLAAMLTVTLVATLAATALWQQWRSVEVEAAERTRVQSTWLLTGALDWARLILRQDASAGGADHLAEPWAVPLQEARLSTFLSMDSSSADADRDAFLSGQITDLQGRMNLTNLIEDDKLSVPASQALARLFDQLGLPTTELSPLTQNMLAARKILKPGEGADPLTPLLPQTVEQLVWLGLSPQTVAALRPYVTLLPERTPLNINTASAEVIQATVPGVQKADATRLVNAREQAHFATLTDAARLMPALGDAGVSSQLAVNSRFFEVRGRVRLDRAVVEEVSVVQRDGVNVRTLKRERGPAPDSAAAR